MNTTKKINVNFSSLVGLKAELLRKQTEVNDAKLRSETVHNFPKAKVKKKPKKAKKENEDEKSQKTEYIEDVNTHKKSKLMLEAKARLYNKLKRSKHNNENFLVDFTNKSDESEEESSQKDEEDENDESFLNDDDWVEYEDCFGRTRKCLREDLLLMQEKDNLIKQQIVTKKGVDPKTNESVEQTSAVEEKEPEIEIMRRKWEEQTQKLADKANIHYQDVLFDEARAHGVGYFAFSQDEEQRAKQQENLSTLRKETERKQKEIKELKELREKMEQNRLKAARIRQRIRAGLPVEPLEELEQKDDNKPDADASEVANEPAAEETANEIKEEEQITEEDRAIEKENKIKALGALLGKRNYWYEMSQEEWVHKCRKVRLDEFAPVYNNFKSAGYLASEDNDEPSINQNDETLESKTQNEAQNANEVNIDSYDIPLPPSSPPNVNEIDSYDIPLPPTFPEKDSNVEDKSDSTAESDSQNNLPETIYEFNTVDSTSSDAAQSQKSNRNIDEASIAAGLRYLRQKFEESQHT
ncbi:coiled-coil domain-containing protein 174 [Andrena cerasifolii]|uniref:coiled-coil domain-containing protein 174 n=1 Tax=Andrena cerasifolii TaxID=2819439 RepID=UPI00403789AB